MDDISFLKDLLLWAISKRYYSIEVSLNGIVIASKDKYSKSLTPQQLKTLKSLADESKILTSGRFKLIIKNVDNGIIIDITSNIVNTKKDSLIQFVLYNNIQSLTINSELKLMTYKHENNVYKTSVTDSDIQSYLNELSIINEAYGVAVKTSFYQDKKIKIKALFKQELYILSLDVEIVDFSKIDLQYDSFWIKYMSSKEGLILINEDMNLNNLHITTLAETLAKDKEILYYNFKDLDTSNIVLDQNIGIESLYDLDYPYVVINNIDDIDIEKVLELIDTDCFVIGVVTASSNYDMLYKLFSRYKENRYLYNKLSDKLIGVSHISSKYNHAIKNYVVSKDCLIITNMLRESILNNNISYSVINECKKEVEIMKRLGSQGGIITCEDELQNILAKAVNMGASDITLTVGKPPLFRLDEQLLEGYNDIKLSKEILDNMFYGVVKDVNLRKKFNDELQLDIAYSLTDIGRFRVSVYQQRGSIAMSFRVVPVNAWTTLKAGIPSKFLDLIDNSKRGLVLITGATGQGKSTTMASLLDYINTKRHNKIITLEDPIEYLHKHKLAVIEQREIGIDAISYEDGLRQALRSNPDILGVGEIRSKESVEIVLRGATTGHMIFSTMHTPTAKSTLIELVERVGKEQEKIIKSLLAENLVAIYSQQLLPKIGGGLVPAIEILINNTSVKSNIKNNDFKNLDNIISQSADIGMVSMDKSIIELYNRGTISSEVVKKYSIDKEFINRLL